MSRLSFSRSPALHWKILENILENILEKIFENIGKYWKISGVWECLRGSRNEQIKLFPLSRSARETPRAATTRLLLWDLSKILTSSILVLVQ